MLFSISSSVLQCRDFQHGYFHPIPLSLSPSLPLFLDLSASLMDSLWKMMTMVCQQAAGPFSQFTWLRWLPRRRQSSEMTWQLVPYPCRNPPTCLEHPEQPGRKRKVTYNKTAHAAPRGGLGWTRALATLGRGLDRSGSTSVSPVGSRERRHGSASKAHCRWSVLR